MKGWTGKREGEEEGEEEEGRGRKIGKNMKNREGKKEKNFARTKRMPLPRRREAKGWERGEAYPLSTPH